MKFTKILAATAISAAFIAAPASAATMGMADLAVTGFFILGADNNLAPITPSNESRTGNATSSFNDVDGTGIGSGNKSSAVVSATVDVQYRCAGPSCGAAIAPAYAPEGFENNASTHIMAPIGNYALGDMYIAGSALTADGAVGLTRADSSVLGPGNEASANATIANSATSTTTFTAGADFAARFVVNYKAYVNAFVGVMAGTTGASLAVISWSLELQEVVSPGNSVTRATFAPAGMNKNFASSRAAENVSYEENNGVFASDLVNLISGRTYKIVIAQASNSLASEARAVPEPGSMLLMAMGLFALGATARRRIK